MGDFTDAYQVILTQQPKSKAADRLRNGSDLTPVGGGRMPWLSKLLACSITSIGDGRHIEVCLIFRNAREVSYTFGSFWIEIPQPYNS